MYWKNHPLGGLGKACDEWRYVAVRALFQQAWESPSPTWVVVLIWGFKCPLAFHKSHYYGSHFKDSLPGRRRVTHPTLVNKAWIQWVRFNWEIPFPKRMSFWGCNGCMLVVSDRSESCFSDGNIKLGKSGKSQKDCQCWLGWKWKDRWITRCFCWYLLSQTVMSGTAWNDMK